MDQSMTRSIIQYKFTKLFARLKRAVGKEYRDDKSLLDLFCLYLTKENFFPAISYFFLRADCTYGTLVFP